MVDNKKINKIYQKIKYDLGNLTDEEKGNLAGFVLNMTDCKLYVFEAFWNQLDLNTQDELLSRLEYMKSRFNDSEGK